MADPTSNVIKLPARPATAPPSLTPAQMLASLRRHLFGILLTGLATGGAVLFLTATEIPKLYTSSAILAVDTHGFAIPALQGAIGNEGAADPMPLVRSEVQVLSARALLQSVADQLQLAKNPEFNPRLRAPGVTSRAWQFIAGLFGGSKAAEPASDSTATDQAMVAEVSRHLSILNDNRSLIITVQFSAQDPSVAANVVNTLVETYLRGKAATRDTANTDANSALGGRVAQMRGDIEALERRIETTRQKYNLVQTRAGSVGQQQLEDLSSALTRASADRAQAQANYSTALALARVGGVAQDSSEVLGSNTIGVLRDREAAAQRRVADLSTTLGPDHPVLQAAQAELAAAHAALVAEARRVTVSLGAQVTAARDHEADLQAQLQTAEASAGNVAGVQSELQQLEKDADARRAVYQTLLQAEAQTAGDKTAPAETGVRVVSLAVPAVIPSSPHPKLAGLLGFLAGCAVAAAFSIVRQSTPRGFAGAADLTETTGVATLAVLRRLPERDGGLAARVQVEPQGLEAEALRALRMRLRFAGGGAPRSVLFLASEAGEGASSMAAAFARVAAQDGLRVLLVEGDLQTPGLARLLGVSGNGGVVATLQGQADWRDVLVRDGGGKLELLLAERNAAQAGTLLETIQMQNLLQDAKEDFNLVVLDGPPVTPSPQAMALAHIVDAVVLVVAARATARGLVQQALDTVTAAAVRHPVAVLNKAA